MLEDWIEVHREEKDSGPLRCVIKADAIELITSCTDGKGCDIWLSDGRTMTVMENSGQVQRALGLTPVMALDA